MASIPNTFAVAPEANPAVYNWTDVNEGTGLVSYYGFQWADDSSTYYGMTAQSSFWSKAIETTAQATGSYADVFNQDFYSGEFTRPVVMRGTAWMQIPWAIEPDVSDDVTKSKATVTVYHYDGTTSTQIGTATTNEYTSAVGTQILVVTALKVDITQKAFNVGDSIRVNVQVQFYKSAGSGTPVAAVGHDPRNRDGTGITPSTESVTTQMVFHLPFRIDR